MEHKNIFIFENKPIRTVWDAGKQYFSVVDVCAALTDSIDPGAYWRKLKQRLKADENEPVKICHGLKMKAQDGKMRITDVATKEQLTHILEAIPFSKAVPFLLRLASIGEAERFYTSPNIQNSKYTPPPLPEICVPRKNVFSALDRATEKQFTHITAPAGSGKTVSTVLWVKRSGLKTVWIGLDEADNSLLVFYRMFCMGMLSAQPENEHMAAILDDPDFDSSPIEHTINLLANFSLDERKYALVLDDVHNIVNPEIVKATAYFIRRLPHSFTTLFLSRIEPRETNAKFIESGQMTLVKSDIFAFSKEEINEYFRYIGRGLTEKEAETIHTFTGGWPINVAAFIHSSASIPEKLDGSLIDYIIKYVWSEWDESLRSFMLICAVLEEMPVPLCEKITGRNDAEEILVYLWKINFPVTFVEDGVYRYHPMFLDLLRAQPGPTEADKKKYWRMATEYYIEQEDHAKALEYAYKSSNIKIILHALENFLKTGIYSFDDFLAHPRAFLDFFPIDTFGEKCQPLYIGYVYVSFLNGNRSLFEKYMDKLKQSLPAILLKYPRFTEFAAFCFLMDYRTPIAKLVSQASLLPPINNYQMEKHIASVLGSQSPFLHRGIRDFYELTDTKLCENVKKTYGKLMRTHFELAEQVCKAGLLLEQNRMNDALVEALSAVSLSNPQTTIEIRFAALMHLAAVYFAMGKKEKLEALVNEIERFLKDNVSRSRPDFLAFMARIKLWNGNKLAAQEWLDNYFVTESEYIRPYRLYQLFTTVRAFAVLGEPDRMKNLAKQLRQTGKDFHRPQDVAEAGVLLASVLWAEGNKDEAQKMMESVLSEMQPYGFIRLIADEGASVLPVLKKVLNKVEREDYQGNLDPIYVNSVYIAAYATSKQRAGIMAGDLKKPIKLSGQQKMIIQLLAQGYKKDGIIEKTGLSLGTVKTHTRLAYEKLNVGNAADAVMKARELGIIE